MKHVALADTFRVAAVFLALATLLGLGCAGCATPPEVSWEQLFLEPSKFNGKSITVEGFYFRGFEVSVLCEDLVDSGYAQGHLAPGGRKLWVAGGIPEEVLDGLQEQHMMGPSERYGRLRVTGRFEYGGGYGHLGAYDGQIVVSGAELLPWVAIR